MDYSQNGEQLIIEKYFGDFKGILLDIGANDGETLSNSRSLIKKGWQAVLVEPSESAFIKLHSLYGYDNKVLLVPYGISNRCGKVKFFDSGTHLKKGDTSLLSTCKESELKRWDGSDNSFTETEIECITIDDLKNLTTVDHYDFITIDAEGLDFEILTQIDLSKTKMVVVETNSIEDKKYIDYCQSFGMKLVHKNQENLIFSRD